jgi:glycosyltransferase involved in cell wall biosynthesis
VVILSAFLTPFRSGAEACVEEVAVGLAGHYDITIVTAKGCSQEGPLRGRVAVVRVGVGSGVDKWLYPVLAPFAVRKLRPHIIHAILETFAGLALHFCRFAAPRAKRLLTLQTLNRSFLKGFIIRSPHAATAISAALRSVAHNLGRRNITVIPNGIRLSAVPSLPKVPGRILFVGRLEHMKGVDTLLVAFAGMRKCENAKMSRCHLRIVGDGSLRSQFEAFSAQLGVSDRVTFVGYVPHPEIYEEYAQAEIFCGLSRSEALGNVFLEAQAGGCAVVGTKVGGIPEIVQDGVTGLLVPPDDPGAAAEILRKLLTDDALRQRLGAEGVRHARSYDWAVVVGRYGELYRELLDQSSSSPE